MSNRRGEKVGWTGGFLGGFTWVAILSTIFLFQGKSLQALVGFVLVAVAVFCVLHFSPWRYPSTPYWKLMIGPYLAFFASMAWAVWLGVIDWGTLLLLPLLLIPLGSLYKKRWSDSNAQ